MVTAVIGDNDRHRSPPIPREDLVHRVWKDFKLAHGGRPVAAAVIIGGAALALGATFGATEVALGATAAYITYRMLRYGVSLKDALTETIELEKAAEEGI